MVNDGMYQRDSRIAREYEDRPRRIDDDYYSRGPEREPRRETARHSPRGYERDRDYEKGRAYDRDQRYERDRSYERDPHVDDDDLTPAQRANKSYKQPTYHDKMFDPDKKTMGGAIRSMAFGDRRIKEPLFATFFKDPNEKSNYRSNDPVSGRDMPGRYRKDYREDEYPDGHRSRMRPSGRDAGEDSLDERLAPRTTRRSGRPLEDEEEFERRAPPRRSGRPLEDEEEFERRPPPRRSGRPMEDESVGRYADDYEYGDSTSRKSSPSSAPVSSRRSRMVELENPKLSRDERIRKLREAQSEHRRKKEEALSDDEEESSYSRSIDREPSRGPGLPSRPRPTPPPNSTDSPYYRPKSPILSEDHRAYVESEDEPREFRLPERPNLVQSAQRSYSPEQEEELITRPAPKPKPSLAQKPAMSQKALRSIPPEPEEQDEAAFLSAARSQLRSSAAQKFPDRSPSPSGRNHSPGTDRNSFEMPVLRPTAPRKVSASKPSEASQKLAELRATKPIIKPAMAVPEAIQQKAALKPPKPILKPKESTAEAISIRDNLKPRSNIDKDDYDPHMAALTEQLKQLKPRSAINHDYDEDDEFDSSYRNNNSAWDSQDSLNHPTKGRAKGPKRRLPTQ